MKKHLYRLLAAGLAFILTDTVLAQSKPEPPVPVRTVPPDYPREMQRDGVAGIVMVSCVIDEKGDVQEVAIEEASATNAFDPPALAAVKKWKFRSRPKSTAHPWPARRSPSRSNSASTRPEPASRPPIDPAPHSSHAHSKISPLVRRSPSDSASFSPCWRCAAGSLHCAGPGGATVGELSASAQETDAAATLESSMQDAARPARRTQFLATGSAGGVAACEAASAGAGARTWIGRQS